MMLSADRIEESPEPEVGRARKIIHVDMDAFYASVEQRDNPELRGKPVAVGGAKARGVVAAASYEARKFGVRSAMPSVIAKLASDHRKPDGLFVITPEMGPAFVETLPVRKFHGIGPATARKMEQIGVRTGLDLRTQTLDFLQQHFGKAGSYYYWAALGIDERPVRADRIRKSVGAENTFPVELFTYEAARDQLRDIIDTVWSYCERSGTRGRTVTVKIKYANFRQITRSRTGQMPVSTRSELEQLGNALLEPLFPVVKGIRLLGISLSSLLTDKREDKRRAADL